MRSQLALLAVLGAVLVWLAAMLVRTPVHAPEVPPDEGGPVILKDPDFTVVALRALELAGFGEEALVGQNWRGEGCRVHSYMLAPQGIKARPILATRDLDTDEIKVLSADEFDALMRRHISFEGGFVPVTFGQNWSDMYFWLGRMPDTDDSTHVYIRFDRTACGLVVDRIWYRGYPKGSEYVDVRIPVLP